MAMDATKAKKTKKEKTKVGKKSGFLDDPKKRKIVGIAVLIVGLITLVVGIVFLVLNLTRGVAVDDSEYLITAENWKLENEEGVIWDFTEVGKGTLTTNDHKNDYDFEWRLEDGKLTIKTNWLYELDNEYDYELDQVNGVLTLTEDGKEYRFLTN